MSYRDDLEAAHARIEALEGELAGRGTPRDERLAAWNLERIQLQARITELEERDRERLATIAEIRKFQEDRVGVLDELRRERDRLVERVRVLQNARAEATSKIVPQPQGGKWPLLGDHNRRYPAATGGTPANVACPQCRAAGTETQLVRELVEVDPRKPASTSEPVTCPRCLFTGLLRIG
jgi:hypothetical protein